MFAHESLGFWNEPLVASNAVRAKDHQHRKWSLRLLGKFIGHAYRSADKLSLASDWLSEDLLLPPRWQSFILQEAAELAKFWFPQSVSLQLFHSWRSIESLNAFQGLFFLQCCSCFNVLYLRRTFSNRVRQLGGHLVRHGDWSKGHERCKGVFIELFLNKSLGFKARFLQRLLCDVTVISRTRVLLYVYTEIWLENFAN